MIHSIKNYLLDCRKQKIDIIDYELVLKNPSDDGGQSNKELIVTIADLTKKYLKKKEINILDFGCGNGLYGSSLKRLGDYNIYACDISISKSRREKLESIGYKIIEKNILDLDMKFDLVVGIHSLEHLYPWELEKFVEHAKKISKYQLYSFPMPYCVNAFNLSYLEASKKVSNEIEDSVIDLMIGSVHKSIPTYSMQGYFKENKIIYYSEIWHNFLPSNTQIKYKVKKISLNDYNELIEQNYSINKFKNKNRKKYENALIFLSLIEPNSLKIIRFISASIYNLKRFIRS